MNPPKVREHDEIHFLIATPKVCSATEAARVHPEQSMAPAHDAFTRLLHRLEPDAATLWHEAAEHVAQHSGILGVDDWTLDTPYAKRIGLVQRHGAGKHHALGDGINLISLLWTDPDRHVPVDYRLDDKAGDGWNKHDHFQARLEGAYERGFVPKCVLLDSWDGSLANLKLIKGWGWVWLTRLKVNRLVNPDRRGLRAVAPVATDATAALVHLKGYGLIRLFKLVALDGDIECWASNELNMSPLRRMRFAGYAWTIEHSPGGLKQFCGVERAQVRAARAQRHHLGLCLRAFLRLEQYCYHAGVSWLEAKRAIIRPAVRAYWATPLYPLPATASLLKFWF